MQPQTKICQNCKNQFIIEPDDFAFYAKINVPPPTWCPECRMIRRFSWRNERSLYKVACGNCKKNIFSAYPPSSPFPIYCHDCWFSDMWDPLDYGIVYDFSKPFFEQFKQLFDRVPRLHMFQVNTINSPYANLLLNAKNVYLSYSVVESEDVYYSKNIDHSRNIYESLNVDASERCFYNLYGFKNYDVSYSVFVRASMNSMLLFDCSNANNCFLSTNLRNKSYVIRNKQCTKEEYKNERERIDTGSYKVFAELLNEFFEMQYKYPRKYVDVTESVNTTGNVVRNAKNAKYVFECYDMENVKYAGRCLNVKDSMDINNTGTQELCYEYISGGSNGRNLKFCVACMTGVADATYCGWCSNSSNLFGCFGIRNKKHCILNKQYTEEEYKNLIPKIIKHMEKIPYTINNGKVYRYGEFFPMEFSPFAYNESVAQEYFPLAKEQATKKGYRWKEEKERNYQVTKTPDQLPDNIKDVPNSITNEIIKCAHANGMKSNFTQLETTCNEQCTTAFKIIPDELQFYRRMNLPLPRLCPNCRHYERMRQRNPLKLWHRQCMCNSKILEVRRQRSDVVYTNTATHFHNNQPCPNEFETSYAPERKEIVYCEQCYNAEVV